MLTALKNDDVEIGQIIDATRSILTRLVDHDRVLLEVGLRGFEEQIPLRRFGEACSGNMRFPALQRFKYLFQGEGDFDSQAHILRFGKSANQLILKSCRFISSEVIGGRAVARYNNQFTIRLKIP